MPLFCRTAERDEGGGGAGPFQKFHKQFLRRFVLRNADSGARENLHCINYLGYRFLISNAGKLHPSGNVLG